MKTYVELHVTAVFMSLWCSAEPEGLADLAGFGEANLTEQLPMAPDTSAEVAIKICGVQTRV
jgi:hypothetical protein